MDQLDRRRRACYDDEPSGTVSASNGARFTVRSPTLSWPVNDDARVAPCETWSPKPGLVALLARFSLHRAEVI
jgi:hypothetical protein